MRTQMCMSTYMHTYTHICQMLSLLRICLIRFPDTLQIRVQVCLIIWRWERRNAGIKLYIFTGKLQIICLGNQ